MNKTVTTEWLVKNLHKPNLVILDASLNKTASGKKSYLDNLMIPTSRFLNLKFNFIDKTSKFPNTVPSSEQFQEECQKLGINKNSNIIVYDNLGVYSSPRVWWLFNYMGHKKISVLDGGLPEWIKNNPIVQKKETNYTRGNFIAKIHSKKLKKITEIISNIEKKEYLLIDARSYGRFKGTEKEPRKTIPSGHIPGSINIPYQNVLKENKFKSHEELQILFNQFTHNSNKLIFSCGSGITACIVLLASELVQEKEHSLYDGSWTEWGKLQLK